MDIEAGEYPWLLNIDENDLSKFKQIVIEFHCIYDDGLNVKYADKVKCLEKMKKTHYLVHAHANNCCARLNNIPEVIELTYVNKRELQSPEFNTTPLPIPNLDYPNNGIPESDWNLSFYPFIKQVHNDIAPPPPPPKQPPQPLSRQPPPPPPRQQPPLPPYTFRSRLPPQRFRRMSL